MFLNSTPMAGAGRGPKEKSSGLLLRHLYPGSGFIWGVCRQGRLCRGQNTSEDPQRYETNYCQDKRRSGLRQTVKPLSGRAVSQYYEKEEGKKCQ